MYNFKVFKKLFDFFAEAVLEFLGVSLLQFQDGKIKKNIRGVNF